MTRKKFFQLLKVLGMKKKLKGAEAKTTNNKMELMAVIQALEALKEPCEIDLCWTAAMSSTDSING